jgi:hypothetical protein
LHGGHGAKSAPLPTLRTCAREKDDGFRREGLNPSYALQVRIMR